MKASFPHYSYITSCHFTYLWDIYLFQFAENGVNNVNMEHKADLRKLKHVTHTMFYVESLQSIQLT